MSLKLGLCSLLLLLFASFSCTDSPSATDNTKVTLTFEDASCIEAWLRLKIENAAPPYTVALSRDGNTLSTLSILSSDTLLIDEGLSPSTTYTYRASLTLDNNIVVQSPDAPARTMDTTSHNWIFDPPVMLGDGASSALYDVAIINDTLAYAVGEIYKQDSLGNWDPLPYNFVKWDGQQWALKRVSVLYRGNFITPPLNAIFAFSATDIWLSSGVPIHGDGQNWTQYHLFDMGVLTQNDGSINKLWGSSYTDLWFVGNRGTIVHYDGTSWRRLESGTGLDVYDVYGDGNQVLAVAAKQFVSLDRRIFQLSQARADSVTSSGIPGSLRGVWFKPDRTYYVVGNGIYYKHFITSPSPWISPNGGVTQFYLYSIDGIVLNDIFICGSFGELLHFNGLTWRSYRQATAIAAGAFYNVAVTSNLCVAIGYDSPRGVVAIGRR